MTRRPRTHETGGPHEEKSVTRQQERARARRRHEDQQKTQKPPVGESTRDKQVFGVILAVILILTAVIAIPRLVGSGSETAPAAQSTAPPTGSATPTSTATTQANGLLTGQKLAAGCTAPPALQAKPKSFDKVPDKATAAGKTWIAMVKTNCGDLSFELDGTKAPQTVASFMNLAQQGYWAPSPCHRLTTEGIFVLQCGDPTGTGSGGPGYTFGIENAPADGTYPVGTLAMARTSDPNSNGGQFFITYKETKLPTEGGGYTTFGKVTKGLDIVERIAAGGLVEPNPNGGAPVSPISILSVSVTEKKS